MKEIIICMSLFFLTAYSCQLERKHVDQKEASKGEQNPNILKIYPCFGQAKLLNHKYHSLIMAGKELWLQDCFFISKTNTDSIAIDYYKFAFIQAGGKRPYDDTCFIAFTPPFIISYKYSEKIKVTEPLEILNTSTFSDTSNLKGEFDPYHISVFEFNKTSLTRKVTCVKGDGSYLDKKYPGFKKMFREGVE